MNKLLDDRKITHYVAGGEKYMEPKEVDLWIELSPLVKSEWLSNLLERFEKDVKNYQSNSLNE